MTEFFRYKKHENMETAALLKKRIANIDEIQKKIDYLAQKKERLFQKK